MLADAIAARHSGPLSKPPAGIAPLGHRASTSCQRPTNTQTLSLDVHVEHTHSKGANLASRTSPIMAFTLIPLQEDDIPRCVTMYFAAFQNAHSIGCWPRIPSVRVWWEQMIYDELHEPGAHWLKAVSIVSGEIAGFVKWQEPKPNVEPDVDLPEWPQGADAKLCNETFGAWAKAHRDLMGSRGHWCKYR